MINEKEILEGNKLIDDFAGNKLYNYSSDKISKVEIIKKYKEEWGINPSEYWLESQRYIPNYYEDFNKLIKVVEKINKTVYLDDDGYYMRVAIFSEYTVFYILDGKHEIEIVRGIGKSIQESTWICVANFVNWYNKANSLKRNK